ncbi:MAG: hypothetical protein NT087_05540 [Deltaproteobacteria bacterium]|nr:hypothetical protein [Deltaproteobacteria bacterium]
MVNALADALVAKEVDKKMTESQGGFGYGVLKHYATLLKSGKVASKCVGAGYSEQTAKEIAALESRYGISRKRGDQKTSAIICQAALFNG